MGALGPPQLGSDDIVRYTGAPHFVEDFKENLSKGRLFVRTKRTFELRSTLHLAIEGPGVSWSVGAEARVVSSRPGIATLELLAFEDEVKPTLELLLDEVQANEQRRAEEDAPRGSSRPSAPMFREEKTLIGTLPSLAATADIIGRGQTRIEARDEDVSARGGPSTEERESVPAEVPTVPPAQARAQAPRTPFPRYDSEEDDDPSVRIELLARKQAQVARIDEDASGDARIEDDESEDEGYDDDSEDALIPESDSKLAPIPRIARPIVDPDEDSEDGEMVPTNLNRARPSHPASSDSSLVELSSVRAAGPSSAPPPPLKAPELPAAPPAAAPAIVEEGIAAYDKLPGLRSTGGGVVRVQDPAQLLGLYLTSLRHGSLALHGGPSGAVGEDVTIKIVGLRVVSFGAKIVAKIGAWVYLEVPETEEIAGLLRDLADQWRPTLDRLGGASSPPKAVAIEPSAISKAEPPKPEPAAAKLEPAPKVEAPKLTPKIEPIARPEAAPSLPPEPGAPLSFDEPGPPQPGRLDQDSIVFRGPKDLHHELSTNLKNGGLIASSTPIPIRTHKSLRVMLGGLDTQIRIEADVVYAAGGRVGFAVPNFGDLVTSIERRIKQGFSAPAAPSVPPPAPASIPPTSFAPGAIGAGPSIAPASIAPAADAPKEIFGRFGTAMSPTDFLDLPAHLIQSEDDLEDTHPLLVLDYVARRRVRGILNFRRAQETLSIYMHEGSVAFVDAQPWSEELSLGRMLVQQKKLTDAQLRDGLDRARRERRPLGKTLLAAGSISANGLVLALREQSRLKIEPAFAWTSGSFDLQPWQDPPVRADLVLASGQGVQVKYLRHVFEQMTTTAIEELLASNLSRVVQLTNEVDPQSALFGFQPKELRFLQAWIDAKRDLSTVVTGSPIGRLASLRLVGFGLAMNLLRFTDGKRAAPNRTLGARRSTDGRGYGAMKRAIEEELRILKTQNYFEVLGIHWSAHHRNYAEAFKKARTRFDPTRGELRDAPPAVQALAKEALAVIEVAYKKLTVEEERIGYRKKLFDQTEREYSADMLAKQAEVMLLRGDRMGAIEAFETAYELAPTTKNRQLLAQARER